MKFNRSNLSKGMTLIELMIVVAIIAILASLAVVNIRSNKSHNALTEFNNQMLSALTGQRSRALTTSRATYLIFNNGKIDLKIGNDSRCTSQENALIEIHYGDTKIGSYTSQNVGFDITASNSGQKRTLNAIDNATFYTSNDPLVTYAIETTSYKVASNAVTKNAAKAQTGTIYVCFQPNGQAEFLNASGRLNDSELILKLQSTHSDEVGGYGEIVIEQYGSIHARYVSFAEAGITPGGEET